MAQIYSRSFDGEKMIILGNQEYFWQPFNFLTYNNDWTEIQIGMFITMTGTSSVSSLLDANSPIVNENLTETPANYTLIGVKNSDNPHDPLQAPSPTIFYGLVATENTLTLTGTVKHILDYNGDNEGVFYVSGSVKKQPASILPFGISDYTLYDSTSPYNTVQKYASGFTSSNYYNLVTFSVRIGDKGSSRQSLSMSFDAQTSLYTNCSKESLHMALLNTSPIYHTQTGAYPLYTGSGGIPLPLPSSLYIKNGFTKNNIRIHSYLIRRLS